MRTVWLCVALAACGSPAGGVNQGEEPDAAPPDAAPPETADLVFDDGSLRTFELIVAPADWDWLNANAEAEQYVPATLRYEGREWMGIGLRYKGGFGTLGLCIDASGRITCSKLSMKLAFDEYDESIRFYGLKKLNLHSMIRDESMLHDRLAYALYRDFGVVAPRAVHAWVTVNGEPLGLFALIEQIDGRFTDDRFGAIDGGDGNLYKEIWPVHTTAQPYLNALETNRDLAPNVDKMIRFAQDIAAADGTTFRATIERWMDVPSLARFLAVDRAIDNWDGIVAWYCVGGTCFNHNYFWYEDATRDRMTLIPWDMDNTFHVPNPIRQNYGMPDWHEIPPTCDPIPIFFGITGLPPACDDLIRGWSIALWDDYAAASRELFAGPFAEDAVQARIDAWSTQIEPWVEIDANGPGSAAWRDAVNELSAEISALRARVEAQLP